MGAVVRRKMAACSSERSEQALRYMLLLWVRGYYGSFSKNNLPCSGQGHLAFQGSHETLVFLIQRCVLSYLYSVSDVECHFVGLHFVGDDSGTSALGML